MAPLADDINYEVRRIIFPRISDIIKGVKLLLEAIYLVFNIGNMSYCL